MRTIGRTKPTLRMINLADVHVRRGHDMIVGVFWVATDLGAVQAVGNQRFIAGFGAEGREAVDIRKSDADEASLDDAQQYQKKTKSMADSGI
jgi:hypothetical protein